MDITPRKRTKIVTLREHTAKTLQEIAAECNVSLSSVKRILNKKKTEGHVDVERKGKCGRKRKLDAKESRLIVRKSIANPRLTAVDLARDVKSGGTDVHVTTIRRRLLEAGLRAQRPVVRQLLTKRMKKKRLMWARKHKDWSLKDWKKVIFSDESHFKVQGQKVQYVRRRRNEKVREAHIQQKVKHPDKKMFWGCFRHSGPIDLVAVEGMMRSQQYIDILSKHLLPHLKKKDVFQQDLAPCHTSKVCKAFFEKKKLVVLDWAGNLPDVNPIENLWSIMKLRLSKMDCTTKAKVISNVNHLWFEDPKIRNNCAKVVESMPNRVQELIQNQGGHINY